MDSAIENSLRCLSKPGSQPSLASLPMTTRNGSSAERSEFGQTSINYFYTIKDWQLEVMVERVSLSKIQTYSVIDVFFLPASPQGVTTMCHLMKHTTAGKQLHMLQMMHADIPVQPCALEIFSTNLQ